MAFDFFFVQCAFKYFERCFRKNIFQILFITKSRIYILKSKESLTSLTRFNFYDPFYEFCLRKQRHNNKIIIITGSKLKKPWILIAGIKTCTCKGQNHNTMEPETRNRSLNNGILSDESPTKKKKNTKQRSLLFEPEKIAHTIFCVV